MSLDSNKLQGQTNGLARAAGIVGERLSATNAQVSLVLTANITISLISLALSPGVWLLSGLIAGTIPAGVTECTAWITNNPNEACTLVARLNGGGVALGNGYDRIHCSPIGPVYSNVATPTVSYLLFLSGATFTFEGGAALQAIRIA